jgi:hypothetical protein
LISCLVDLALVVDLLHNVEFDLHGGFLGAAAISADLSTFLIIVIGVRSIRVR